METEWVVNAVTKDDNEYAGILMPIQLILQKT